MTNRYENEVDERLLANVMRELAGRQAKDPLKTCELHAKQKSFCSSVLDGRTKENWFIAANRAGKSQAGAYCGAHLARFGAPGPVKPAIGTSGIEVRDRATAGWVSALDFPTSRDTLQPKYFDNGMTVIDPHNPPFIPAHEIAEWRVSDQLLRLKNGSVIGFKSADSGRAKYQGAARDWVHLDEEHPYDIYEEITMRVGSKPMLFFCTATILPPDNVSKGHVSWVFPKIIQPWKDGTLTRAALFGASIYDNPHIPQSEIAYLESLHPIGSVSRRIRLEGEWLPGIGGSRAYTGFDRMIHVAPQPELAARRPLAWMWDFNVEPLCTLVGQYDGNLLRVHRELILQSGSITDMCTFFYEKFPHHSGEIHIYGDASGNNRGQTAKTDYYLILQEMKSYGVPIRLKVPESNPHVVDRVNAVNRMCLDQDGQVRLQIDPSCSELILDMEGVLRDPSGGILKTYNKKDPYFQRTHTSDGLGYMISYEEPVRPPSTARGNNGNIPKAPSYSTRH